MKKTLIGVLLGVCLLAACGKPEGKESNTKPTKLPETTAPAETTQAPENTKAPEATKVPETTQVPEPTKEPETMQAPVPLQLLLEQHTIEEWEEGKQLYSVLWQNPVLGAEDAQKYPFFAVALDALKKIKEGDAAAMAEELAETAERLKPYAEEMQISCYDSTRYYVQRADNRILSMMCHQVTDMGSIHPMKIVSGFNFDPETGKTLRLADVTTDTETLVGLVKELLREKYSEELFEDWEESFDEFGTDGFSWTMDYDGITFHFSQYILAAYAYGVLTAKVDFAQTPELFREEYVLAPEQGHVSRLAFYSETEIGEKSGTGEKKVLIPGQYRESEYEDRLKLEINIDGENKLDYDLYAYEFTPYLVEVEEKEFLYVQTVTENDYKSIYVFDLSEEQISEPVTILGGGFVGMLTEEETGSYGEWVFTNPANFSLSSRMDVFRTMEGVRAYTVDTKTGIPIPQTEIFLLNEEQTPLVTKLPVEVTMVADGSKETLPVGTELVFLRSDGETYVEFRMPDGRECRVTRDSSEEWPMTVNGVPEEDVFDGIAYAG